MQAGEQREPIGAQCRIVDHDHDFVEESIDRIAGLGEQTQKVVRA